MKKNSFFLMTSLLIVVIAGYTLFYYNYVFSRHIFHAKLISIKDDEVVFQLAGGEKKIVHVPEIIIPLLKEEKQYFVAVYSNKLRGPFLKDIEEVSTE